MVGYLIVRGGVHRGLCQGSRDLTGANVTKLLPEPETTGEVPRGQKVDGKGFHRILYRFSPEDYREIGEIWNGIPASRSGREVQDGPPHGGPLPDLDPAPPLYAPTVDAEDIEEIAKRL